MVVRMSSRKLLVEIGERDNVTVVSLLVSLNQFPILWGQQGTPPRFVLDQDESPTARLYLLHHLILPSRVYNLYLSAPVPSINYQAQKRYICRQIFVSTNKNFMDYPSSLKVLKKHQFSQWNMNFSNILENETC